jgi:hypothetical protein
MVEPGFEPRQRQVFFFLQSVLTGHGALSDSYSMGTELYPGDKAEGRDIEHLPPTKAEMKNEWGYTSTTLYAFTVWTGETVTFLPFLTPYLN